MGVSTRFGYLNSCAKVGCKNGALWDLIYFTLGLFGLIVLGQF
jgi:hypothetical protein